MHRAVLAAAVVFAGSVVVAPQAAAEEPVAGDACTTADLGRRLPQVDSIRIEPTITHFTSFFVTTGSVGEREIRLETQDVVEVMVNNEVFIKAGFSIASLFNVETHAKRFVQKVTRSTSTTAETIRWRFEQPGYYGVYKGTRKVSGTLSGLNCTRVTAQDGTTSLRWITRQTGPYTTFSHMEEGAVRCEDVVPVNSLMYEAQKALGCFGTPQRQTPKPAPAEEPHAVGAVTNDVLTDFTCEPDPYRIGLGNGLYWYWYEREMIDMRGYDSRRRNYYAFYLCRGPGQGDGVEHLLVSQSEDCVSLVGDDLNTDGILIDDLPCRTFDDNQRWYVNRDATNPNAIGLQVKRNGYMIGQNRLADAEALRLFSSGVANGEGTYYLEPLP